MIDEARIEARGQLGQAAERAADHLCLCRANQNLHLRVARARCYLLDEDEARLAQPRGVLKLALGGRDALRVFRSIILPKEADVHGTALDRVQIGVIRPLIAGRQVFKDERREEAPKQGIALDERLERAPFLGKFPLDAADEDRRTRHEPEPAFFAIGGTAHLLKS